MKRLLTTTGIIIATVTLLVGVYYTLILWGLNRLQ